MDSVILLGAALALLPLVVWGVISDNNWQRYPRLFAAVVSADILLFCLVAVVFFD